MLVGYHWFQHADQPSEGRSDDGENSNYGVVTIADDTYQEITRSMTAVNADADRLHNVASIGSGSLPIGPKG
jgi:agarase